MDLMFTLGKWRVSFCIEQIDLTLTPAQWRLFVGIARMCLTHGMVMGLFGLAVEDLGMNYAKSHHRLGRLAERGLVNVQNDGYRLRITLPDHVEKWAADVIPH